MNECRNGHRLTGSPVDTLPSGSCRTCDRLYQAKYKRRRSTAMTLMKALEDRGITVDKPQIARLVIVLEVIGKASPRAVQKLIAMHPDLIRGVLEEIAEVPWYGRHDEEQFRKVVEKAVDE